MYQHIQSNLNKLFTGLDKVIGKVSLGNTDNNATKIMVIMARGLSVKWKQIIGVHLTDGHGFDAQLLWKFVSDGANALEQSGYHVLGVTSDMGALNQSMWRHLGITATKCVTRTFIPHPVRQQEIFYIFADVPHLLKNLKSMFLKHNIILGDTTVQKYNLCSNIVSANHINMYLEISPKEKTFTLAPHLLQMKNLLNPNHFEQMRVQFATRIFCEQTAVALVTAQSLGLLPEEVLVTSWFINQVSRWFKTMTSRHYRTAINKKNFQVIDNFLGEFTTMIRHMKTADNKWKPSQRGIIISTENMRHLSQSLIYSKNFNFLQTSRLTQDAVENTFSRVRVKGTVHPSALQALRAVRLISVSQFTKEVPRSNYAEDNDKFYLNFLSSPVKKGADKLLSNNVQENILLPKIDLHPLELDALHHFTGYVISKIFSKICKNCQEFSTVEKEEGYTSVSSALKDKGGLQNSSIIMQLVSEEMEKICVHYTKIGDEHLLQRLILCAHRNTKNLLPTCDCHFSLKFCEQFIKGRLQFHLKSLNDVRKKHNVVYASKSANKHIVRKLF